MSEPIKAEPFINTAQKDRHFICEIGRLFWGDNKQCYAADAVYNQVKALLWRDRVKPDSKNQPPPEFTFEQAGCKTAESIMTQNRRKKYL